MKKVWSILAVLSMSLTALQAVETSVKQLSVDDFYKMKVYNNSVCLIVRVPIRPVLS